MSALREWAFRAWYWYVNNIDKKAEILFMNYGYSDPADILTLYPEDEPNRFSIQLYNLLAGNADLRNKDIAEIGCGRGGGLAFIVRRFSPETATGIDLDKHAVAFCNSHYKLNGLSFQQGDVQQLSLKNESFDVIFNVESSHRYPRMDLFLGEVLRLLRPGGLFLYTDFRYDYEMPALRQMLKSSGMSIVKEQLITKNVVDALKADDERRRKLVYRLAPRFLQGLALNFAGTVGSETYNQFASRKYEYYYYIMKKE